MTATYESIMEAALQRSPDDRCRIASGLWECVGGPVHEPEGDELEGALNQREVEIESDPSQELSNEAFMAPFASRRLAHTPS